MKIRLLLILSFFFVSNLQAQKNLRALILSCDIPPLKPDKELSLDGVEVVNVPDENGVSRPCYSETWSAVTSFDELVSLNPNNNTIWPGAAIQGKSLQNGSLNLIPINRRKGRITLTGLNFSDNKPNYVDVSNISESEIKEGIKKLTNRPNPRTEASYSYFNSQIYSVENGLTSMGLSVNWAWGAFKAQLSNSDFKSKNVFVIKLVQKYYSVSFSEPKSPASIFSKNASIDDAKLYMGKGNPPALITNVNYGRIIFLTIETTENAESFKAMLNASFDGFGVSGKANFNEEQSKKIQNSDIKIFAIGGDSKLVAEVITSSGGISKWDKLKEYIEKGSSFSNNSTGVPIGYKAIYLSNNQVAAINSAYQFKKVRCEDYLPYRKPMKVTVVKFITRDVDDDDEDMEFSYKIEFLGENDKILDELSNKKPVTYVQEPRKVGGEKRGVNMFFNDESKTVNQPVFAIRCTVWAKSHDRGCKMPWGTRGKSTSKAFRLADFNANLFNAWDCLDLYFKIE